MYLDRENNRWSEYVSEIVQKAYYIEWHKFRNTLDNGDPERMMNQRKAIINPRA